MFKSFTTLFVFTSFVLIFSKTNAQSILEMLAANIECPQYTGMPGIDMNKVKNKHK